MKKHIVLVSLVLSLFSNTIYSQFSDDVGVCKDSHRNPYVWGEIFRVKDLPTDGSARVITYYVNPNIPNYIDGIDEAYISNSFATAISRWSSKINNLFTTQKVNSESLADVKIYWLSRANNANSNAQATYPRDPEWGIITFTDEKDLWVKNANYPNGSRRNFDGVMQHETGHLLGLCHNELNTVMTQGNNSITLTAYDIKNIRAEYLPVTYTNRIKDPNSNSEFYGGSFRKNGKTLTVEAPFSTSSNNKYFDKERAYRVNNTLVENKVEISLEAFENQYVPGLKRNSKFESWWLDETEIATTEATSRVVEYNENDPTHQYEFTAKQKGKWNVVINGETEFDGSIKINRTPFAQNESGNIVADETKTVAGKTLYFGGWKDELTRNTHKWSNRARDIYSVTSDMNKTALYKYKQHTANPSAIETTQRRYVNRAYYLGEDAYGSLGEDIVYTSDGNVWHEYYGGNGWTVRKVGNPNGATAPAIATDEWGEFVAIVYQQGSQLRLQVYLHSPYVGHFLWHDDHLLQNTSQSSSLMPTVVIHDGKILVVYNVAVTDSYLGSDGLYYCYVDKDGTILSSGKINNTGGFHINPSLSIDRNSNNFKAHLVYEFKHDAFSTGVIYWTTLTSSSDDSIVQSSREDVTSNLSLVLNKRPSVIVKNDGTPVVVWQNADNRICVRTRSSGGTWSSIVRELGNGVSNGMIQRAFLTDDYIVGWTEGTSVKYAKNSDFSATSAGISGNGLQIATGETRNSIKMLTVGTDTYHTFNYKTSLGKISSLNPNYARKGTVFFGETHFYFMLADILKNQEKIEFVEITEKDDIENLAELNNFLQSVPFDITDGDELQFSIKYGSLYDSKSLAELNETDCAKFKIELFDVDNNLVLGTYDEISYQKNNIDKEKETTYKLTLKDIGTKNVALRLVVESSMKNNFILTSISADSEILSKSSDNYDEICIDQSSVIPSSSNLYDNYPNPFNPTTMIKYHLKETAHVTLKVFNMLGQEIVTLVDHKQVAGEHQINFDASNLSSGIYLYRLDTQNYSETKKMTLLR